MNKIAPNQSTPKKYTMTIEKHISGDIVVYADALEEALRMTEEKYKSDDFVVNPSAPVSRLMIAQCEDLDAVTGWVEF